MAGQYQDRQDSKIYGSRLIIHRRVDLDNDNFYFRAKVSGHTGYIRRSCALSAAENNLADVQLVAIQTSASDMPTGRLSYSGKALVVLNDGSDTYEVLMDATMDADLRSNSGIVGITASGVNSAIQPQVTAANGVTTNYAATGSEQITLTGATVSGVGISGGTDATATGWNGDASNVIIGSVNADTSGVFAGAQAAEIAGTSVVTGSGGCWFNMTFAGKQ